MNDWVLEESCERSSVIPSHFRGEKKRKGKYNKVLKDKLFQKEFESSQCTVKPVPVTRRGFHT